MRPVSCSLEGRVHPGARTWSSPGSSPPPRPPRPCRSGGPRSLSASGISRSAAHAGRSSGTFGSTGPRSASSATSGGTSGRTEGTAGRSRAALERAEGSRSPAASPLVSGPCAHPRKGADSVPGVGPCRFTAGVIRRGTTDARRDCCSRKRSASAAAARSSASVMGLLNLTSAGEARPPSEAGSPTGGLIVLPAHAPRSCPPPVPWVPVHTPSHQLPVPKLEKIQHFGIVLCGLVHATSHQLLGQIQVAWRTCAVL